MVEDDTKKRKASDADDEPAAKEAKKDGEEEQDAPADSRPRIKDNVTFNVSDCTLNVLPGLGGKVLMSLAEGGMQFLIAGARANVGIKSGRYMFEVKILESPMPRQLLRIGVSLAGANLILGSDESGVCFDSDGAFIIDPKTKKTSVTPRITKDQTIGVLLNLDSDSANCNTISLFRNGERLSKPQALPESFKGQALYPHISFRGVSVQVNFGANPTVDLPFQCRMVSSASAADVVVSKQTPPADGKYEVAFPVAFPDEGTFDWLETFLEKNPSYVELSDRKIVDWAGRSGLWKPKSSVLKSSNDKPDFNYGLALMDDLSARRVLQIVAPLVPRNYVVMEVKENLTKADRKANLQRFSSPAYKKTAYVVMGEPSDDYKKIVHSRILKEKKEKADKEWETKKEKNAKAKQLAEMRKKAEEARKKAADERKAKELAKQKAKELAKKKKEEEEKKEEEKAEGEEKKEDAKEDGEDEAKEKEEAKEDEKKDAEEEKKEEEEKQEEAAEEQQPEVVLTEEEKNTWFLPSAEKDLTSQALNQAFGNFSLPENDEGFDSIRYEWQPAEKANDYLRTWVLDKKLTSPMDDLKPSDWFKSKLDAYKETLKPWQDTQKSFQKAGKKEESLEDDKLDIFAVEDILDVGNGEPLFVSFAFEDWTLLTLRYELLLLTHAFKHDVNDEERVGIHETNLLFYYTKYFQKTINAKHFGKEAVQDVLDLVKDTVIFDADKNVLTAVLTSDLDSFDMFVKLAEDCRRERQRRVEAGDQTAKLKFSPLVNTVTKPALPASTGQAKAPVTIPAPREEKEKHEKRGGWGKGGKGGKGGWNRW